MMLSNDHKGNLGSALRLDEYSQVVQPFMEQLKAPGSNSDHNQVLELKMLQTPEESFRWSFMEVILFPNSGHKTIPAI